MRSAFDSCARDYATSRPGYPAPIFTAIRRAGRLRRGDLVLDLGAGTGISTLAAVEAGWKVVAVEPGALMIAEARKTLGGRARLVRAVGERLPFRDGCVRAAICAQTFHWLDPRRALPELARVVAPGGLLAVFWNNRDTSRLRFFREYHALVRRYNPAWRPDYRDYSTWRRLAPYRRIFGPPRHRVFRHMVVLAPDRFRTYVQSVSYVRNALKPRELRSFLRELDGLVARRFPEGVLRLPYRTDVWLARRA